jgi:hypothetical protein
MTRLVAAPNDKSLSFLRTNGLGEKLLFVLRILQNKTRSVCGKMKGLLMLQ